MTIPIPLVVVAAHRLLVAPVDQHHLVGPEDDTDEDGIEFLLERREFDVLSDRRPVPDVDTPNIRYIIRLSPRMFCSRIVSADPARFPVAIRRMTSGM